MTVIADVKRNDIGSTAAAYSTAYLGGIEMGGETVMAYNADFATVNAYLGTDGVAPFLADCKKYGKGFLFWSRRATPAAEKYRTGECR